MFGMSAFRMPGVGFGKLNFVFGSIFFFCLFLAIVFVSVFFKNNVHSLYLDYVGAEFNSGSKAICAGFEKLKPDFFQLSWAGQGL